MQRNRAQKEKITESTSPENAQTMVTSSEKGERRLKSEERTRTVPKNEVGSAVLRSSPLSCLRRDKGSGVVEEGSRVKERRD